ncbi:ATP-dependent nuclease, subunit B [Agrilactobacillus composti DSM 18527 = JCM 14202]|nr:ATP-dependent nuclease, subunit B [Agrilactobacillus composti DSM 18527 = JCM 14202]
MTSLFAIDTNHFRYADIMGLLKTELLLPKTATGYVTKNDYRRQLDITDNYLLAHNLYQRDWLEATPWTFQVKTYTEMATDVQTDPVKSEAIETIHQLIRLNLAPFFDKLHRAKDAKTGARILYEFLKDVGVLDQLIAWENEAAQLNQTQQIADKNSQGFNVFIQLLDQYVAILGDSEFDVPTFVALLTAAFNNTAYAQIPSTLDAVSVSEVGIVQMNNRKMTFFIGLNDQNLPEIAKPETILNDEDRTSLATLSPEFDELPTTEHVMANESFLAYTAFLNPNSQLFLSYAKTNSEGVESKPSPYLQRLCTHFAMSPTQLPDNLPATEHIATLAPLIGTKRQVLHRLVPTLRQVQNDRQALGTPLTYIEKLLTQDKTIQHLARQVFSSLHYFNKPQPLKPKIVDLLFGDTLNASVSQLETFYRNPYAYFLTYGLKLQEREIYDLSPASRGSFYHEVMDEFMKFLVDQHLNIADLKEGQIDMILNEILDRVYQMPQYDILSSTGRMHYIRYKLKEILKISIRNNILQSQHMRFKPFRTEIPFGSGQNSLRSLDYKLDPQHKVRIRGKIDRIDTAAVSNNQFFNIIDYKSSDHDLKYQQVFYGLSLQMLTYVQSVLDNLQALDLPKAQFAGAYYFHLHNPVIKLKDLKSGIDTAAIDGKVLTDFRYKGLILNDEAVLQIADEKIDKDSQVVPLYYSKNKDTFSSRSNSLVTPAQLQTLLAFNAHKIQAAAQAIFAGQLPLEPVRFSNNNTALNFSPYLPIFQFDAMLPENNYRDLGKDPSKRSAVIDYWLDKMLHVLNQSD